MTVDQLIHKLEEIYGGNPWHGASMTGLLSSVPNEHFSLPVSPGEKTISHILEHIIAWRQFAIEKLKENQSFDIPLNTEADWPKPQSSSNPKQYYLDRLNQSQRELLSLLKTKDDTWLNEDTHNKSYKNNYLIQGIVEHDLYHSGQIGIFNSLLVAQNNSN
ncbi:MAG: DinB family protein [Reichenbachiella sp.]|uniref:DinB family protein n=1 Tax=Reichenbachiella sp. TaxID=2184521 RepID=UPI003265D70C